MKKNEKGINGLAFHIKHNEEGGSCVMEYIQHYDIDIMEEQPIVLNLNGELSVVGRNIELKIDAFVGVVVEQVKDENTDDILCVVTPTDDELNKQILNLVYEFFNIKPPYIPNARILLFYDIDTILDGYNALDKLLQKGVLYYEDENGEPIPYEKLPIDNGEDEQELGIV